MTCVLVDGSSYIYRAFYSQPPMTKMDGTPIGAIHGYSRMLWNLKKKHVTATHFAVVLDKGRSTARTAIYPEYKAQRTPMPDDLRSQLGLIRDATRAFRIPVVEAQGIEADDLIASYASASNANGDDALIISVDKDLMQTITTGRPSTAMWDPVKETEITPDYVYAKFGVWPHQMRDLQALMGDTSDNVPGIPSVGPKTAAALLKQFGSFDGVMERWREINKPKIRDMVMAHRANALLSRELVTLKTDAELPVPMKELESVDVDAATLVDFAKSMEMISFAADVESFYGVPA